MEILENMVYYMEAVEITAAINAERHLTGRWGDELWIS